MKGNVRDTIYVHSCFWCNNCTAYNQSCKPIFYVLLQYNTQIKKTIFGILDYLALKFNDKYGDADAIILHYIVMDKEEMYIRLL